MILAAFVLNALLMVLLPIVVGVALWRRLRVRGALLWWGALTFVLSQVVHIPVNLGVSRLLASGAVPSPGPEVAAWLVPLALGLSAGLHEEIARWLGMRFVVRDVRDRASAVLYGAGHGGVEAFVVGLLAATQVINLVLLRDADLAAWGVAPDQIPVVRAQVDAAWALPPWQALMGFVERALTLPLHIALSVIVAQCFVRGGARWLVLAVALHALVDAGAVALMAREAPLWAVELFVAAVSLSCVGVALALRDPARAGPAAEPVRPIALKRAPLPGEPSGGSAP